MRGFILSVELKTFENNLMERNKLSAASSRLGQALRHPREFTVLVSSNRPSSGAPDTHLSRSIVALGIMLARPLLGRNAQRALRIQCLVSGSRRGLASPASGSFAYETGEVSGVKFASRDLTGPTTTLAVVAKAGSRYQFAPGLADGLENFMFKVQSSYCSLTSSWEK